MTVGAVKVSMHGADEGFSASLKIPKTLDELKLSIQRFFNTKEIGSLYTRNGRPISSIKQLKPGMMIRASVAPQCNDLNINEENENYGSSNEVSTMVKKSSRSIKAPPKQRIPVIKSDLNSSISFNDNESLISAAESLKVHKKKSFDLESCATSFTTLDRDMDRFLDEVCSIEISMKNWLYKRFTEYLGEIPSYSNEVGTYAVSVLKSSFYSAPNSNTGIIRMKKVIIGPRKGGKSTFLKILTKTLLQTILSRNMEKTNIIYYFDINNYLDVIDDPKLFLERFTTSTITQLSYYYPLLHMKLSKCGYDTKPSKTPVLDELIRVFSQFGLDTFTKPLTSNFPRYIPFEGFRLQIEDLCQRFQTAIETDDTDMLLKNIFNFPKAISNIFGFKSVFIALDHIDSSDIEVTSDEKGLKTFKVIEYVKHMLYTSNFMISVTDEAKIYDILRPSKYYIIDLTFGNDFVSICNMIQKTSKMREIVLEFEDGKKKSVKYEDTCFCPGFVHRWNKIAKAYEKPDDLKSKFRVFTQVKELAQDLISEIDVQTLTDYVIVRD